MPDTLTLAERGTQAAIAYLERMDYEVIAWDMKVLQPDDPDASVPIIAMDHDVLVIVDVTTRTEGEEPRPSGLAPSTIKLFTEVSGDLIHAIPGVAGRRFDRIDILVLAPDRALLRHHRAVYHPDGEPDA